MSPHMPYGDITVKRAGWQKPADIRCRRPEFAAHLDASATYDQQQRSGQVYRATHKEGVAGHMVLAMYILGKGKQHL